MHLTRLTLNPRSSAVRRDLACPYEMHRSLMKAFPDALECRPGRVLFRVELPTMPTPPFVLVQSQQAGDWAVVGDRDDYLLGAETKTINLQVGTGRRLRFKLRANPTVKRDGRRYGLCRCEDQLSWLQRKGDNHGFRPIGVSIRRSARAVGRPAARNRPPNVHQLVDFEGALEVTDRDRFRDAIERGIGSAKGFGFGLFCVAPAG